MYIYLNLFTIYHGMLKAADLIEFRYCQHVALLVRRSLTV